MSPRTAPHPVRDRGATVVELLVMMGILGILAPLFVAVLRGAATSSRATLETADAGAVVRLALDHLDRQVRSGNQPLTITPTSLSLNTCADAAVPADLGRVRTVEFRLSGGALQTRSYRAGAAAGTWRTLAAGLDASSQFSATGARSVAVSLVVKPPKGHPSSVSTVLLARNSALPTPLPSECP